MSASVFYRRRAERFAQLLDEADGGPRHHSRGRTDEQLAELVAVGTQLSAARPEIGVDPEFRASLRAMLVATAEREGIGATARPESAPQAGSAGRAPRFRGARQGSPGSRRRLRARGAIVVGVAAGALAVSGMSAASENAVPGDALYGVKRQTERAQLALAGSDVTRGQLFLDFARNRLAEAATVPAGDAGLARVLGDMDADTRQGVKLLTTAAVQRRDAAALQAVDGFVAAQRRDLTGLLDRLSGENREHAVASLDLLVDVERRAGALASGITCGMDGVSGADELGPQPQVCWSAPGNAANDPQQQAGAPQQPEQTKTSRPRTEQAGPSGAPPSAGPGQTAGTDPGAGPSAGTEGGSGAVPRDASAPAEAPSPSPSPSADGGVLGDIGRLLGGILG